MRGRMRGMSAAPKVKLSITLSKDLVGRIDRFAAGRGATRSAVVERWLLRAERLETARAIEQATIDYYENLDQQARGDDEALAQASSQAARRIRVDQEGATRSRRR